ncbi:MAG: DNA-processing protein DprA [Patescibacteria group bacterium]
MDQNELACFSFSYLNGVGPCTFKKLVDRFGSPYKAYMASGEKLTHAISVKHTELFALFRKNFEVQKELKKLEQKHIRYIAATSSDYPSSLTNISDPPIGLFCKGNTSLFASSGIRLAVVGTRKPSNYGQRMTKLLVGDLAKIGVVIVSGMALGIDTVAHDTALAANGKTIAVLGCGVDIVYPYSNKKLYERILENNGLIVSEFPPGLTVLPGLFVARNRIVSGLSYGTIVIEGSNHSGSLITASYAAEQGKEIFAVPGQVGMECSEAPNILLKQGAHPVTCTQDVTDALGLRYNQRKKKVEPPSLSPTEKSIYALLESAPSTLDELLTHSLLSVPDLSITVSQMELQGIIEKNQEGRWQIV